MAYYTERHGMRRPVAKTYDITVEKYALLFQCCEKYYDNIAWKYPAAAPMGRDAVEWIMSSFGWICDMRSPHYTEMMLVALLLRRSAIMYSMVTISLSTINMRCLTSSSFLQRMSAM